MTGCGSIPRSVKARLYKPVPIAYKAAAGIGNSMYSCFKFNVVSKYKCKELLNVGQCIISNYYLLVIRSALQQCISGSATAPFKVGSINAFIYCDRNRPIHSNCRYTMQASVLFVNIFVTLHVPSIVAQDRPDAMLLNALDTFFIIAI